jgi:AraC family transcriptional regulator, transcriptional activator of pobA
MPPAPVGNREDGEMTRKAAAAGVPTVAFYGDVTEWSTSALLHSEPLIERSRAHAWRIRAHRHSSLAQLFWLARGAGMALFDGERYALAAPCVGVVPALCVHEFEWQPDCDGYALSLASALVQDLGRQIGSPAAVFASPTVISTAADSDYVQALFARIQEEYVAAQPYREIVLDSLVRALAVRVARATAPERRAERMNRGAHHYQRFTELLQRQHRAGWSVADYADRLGITPAHLNVVCRKAGGASALQLIHDRVLLAARRELAYTDRSIADIAAGLGFQEPSYFTRFFKRRMQMTPKQYRRRSGTQAG